MGLAIFGSSSSNRTQNTTTTQTWTNSGNSSFSTANTFENVGNPSLTIGLPGSGTEGAAEKVIVLFVAVVLVLYGIKTLNST